MKKQLLIILSLLIVCIIFVQSGLAQDYHRWGLPKGAKARLGKGWITDMAFSPDGNQLAVACSIGIWLYNVHTGDEEAFLKGHTELVTSVAYSPDGSTLTSGSDDWTIRLWNVENRKHIKTLEGHTGPVNSVAYSPNGKTLASGSDDGIRLWNVENWQYKQILKKEAAGIISVAYSSDGKILTGGSTDSKIYSWNVESGEQIWAITGYKRCGRSEKFPLIVKSLAYSADGKTLASWCGGEMRLWNVVSSELRLIFEQFERSVYALAFSPDSNTIVTGSHDGTIHLWDKTNGEHKRTLLGHSDMVTAVVYSPNRDIFVSASLDGTIRLWGAVGKLPKRIFTGHTRNFDLLTYSPNGKTLASRNSTTSDILVWDAETFQHKLKLMVNTNDEQGPQVVERRNRMEKNEEMITSLTYSPDGATLVTGGMNNTIRFWDMENGKLKRTLDAKNDEEQPLDQNNRVRYPHTITSLAYSLDGKTLVSGRGNGRIQFWDLESRQHLQTLAEHRLPVIYLRYSSDSSMLISGTYSGRYADDVGRYSNISIWDIRKQQLFKTINVGKIINGVIQKPYDINFISFSPDTKIVAGASGNKMIYLWNTETGILQQAFFGHAGEVTSVAYSPDGSTLASTGDDNIIRLWDAGTGQYKWTLAGHLGDVTLATFSSEGNTLASASDDGTILLWDISAVTQVEAQKSTHNKTPNISQWHLPEGSSARLGKGSIKDIAYSPDGNQLAVASSIGTWIYDVHTGEEHALFTGPMASVDSVAYSPDGKMLVGRNSHELYSLDVVTGKYLYTILLNTYMGGQYGTPTFGFLPDGNTLVSWSHGDMIQLWNAATGQHKQTIEGTARSKSLAFSPDGETLVYSISGLDIDKKVQLWDVLTSQHKQTLSGHKDGVELVLYAPDGNTFASLGNPHYWDRSSTGIEILLWDAETSNLKYKFLCDMYVDLIMYSPDGKTLAAGSINNIKIQIYLWDVLSGKLKHTLAGNAPFVYSPDGKIIASGNGNTVSLWDVASGEQLQTLNGNAARIALLRYSPDGKTLTSVDKHNMIHVWDVSTGKLKHTLEHTSGVKSVAYSPDGKTLACGGFGNKIRLWDVASRTHKRSLTGLTSAVYSVAYSPDGNTLASTGAKDAVLLWDVLTGAYKQTSKFNRLNFHVYSVVYSPNGATLAFNGPENTIVLWDVLTSVHKRTLTGHTKNVRSLAYSPDGKTLASGSLDANIQLWDTSTGKHKRTLSDNIRPVLSVAFSPDGTTLASTGDHSSIHLWDLESGEIKSVLTHNQIGPRVHLVAFSSDGMILASGSERGTIHLWNAHTGKLKRVFFGHRNDVKSLVFSPDSKTLASGSWDGTTLLWDLTEFNNTVD